MKYIPLYPTYPTPRLCGNRPTQPPLKLPAPHTSEVIGNNSISNSCAMPRSGAEKEVRRSTNCGEVLAVGKSGARTRSNCDTPYTQTSVKAHVYPRMRVYAQPCRGVTAPIGLMGLYHNSIFQSLTSWHFNIQITHAPPSANTVNEFRSLSPASLRQKMPKSR
jgi:hypothetical protein